MLSGFRFANLVARRSALSAAAVSRAPARHMSIFTQKTGALQSRLVVDAGDSSYEREPLTPVKKAQLSLLVGAAAVAFGTILYGGATTQSVDESVAERSLREERVGYSSLVRERLFATFGYFASSLALTAGAALAMSRSVPVVRLALRSPIMFGIGTFVVSLGGMFGALMVSPENALLKHTAWLTFTTASGAMMLPIAIMGGPIVAQAAAATGLMVGGISGVAAVAPNDSFLWMRGGLTIGLMAVVGASLGQMFFPASSLLMNVSLYGGLCLFGGFQLYDTQRVAAAARALPPNVRYDALGQSIRLYQNTLNIFIRFVQIFAQQGQSKRR